MGYLFSFRPGLRSVAMALQEAILPRVIGKDATAVEGIWNDIPILQPDPMRGGFTDLRKIAVLADTYGMTIAPHLFPELNVQLLASIPNGIWIEDMGLSNDLFVDPVTDGMITAPERPGHGLVFRPEILRECRAAD